MTFQEEWELNEQIHTEVMGHHMTQVPAIGMDGKPTTIRMTDDLQGIPRYCANIEAAWLVVEKLRERFTNVALHAANGWGLTCWDVTRDGDEVNTVDPTNAETAPLAICRAALAAVRAGAAP